MTDLTRRQWLQTGIPAATGALIAAGLPLGGGANPAIAEESTSPNPSLHGARLFNIRTFGAKGDAKTLDTAPIQQAIDAAAADDGGTVLIPAGTFVIGPIELKSNVTLHLAADATLQATTDISQYHPARGIPLQGDHTMGDGNTGLLYAANANNVTIEGPGTIDGQGDAVRANGLSGNRRCHLALFYKCTNLRIRDLSLLHSCYHTLRICNSSYVWLTGIRIFSRVVGNNDGLHFISADHVTVSDCHIRCQDDACALFGSCQYVLITNSSFSTRWSVFRFGGGIANHIAVSNCLLYQVFGCPFKLRAEPGSRYENISFADILLDQVTGPISIGAGPMPRRQRPRTQPTAQPESAPQPPTELPPATIRNISFQNISGTVTTRPSHLDDSTFTGATNVGEQHSCIVINAVEGHIVENISLSNIHLRFGGGGTAEEAARRELPPFAGEYFQLGPMPAYGLYARNARALTLNNLRLETETPDLRPALILDNIEDASLTALAVAADANAESALRFINVRDALLTAPRLLTPTATFLRVEGEKSRNLTLDGGQLTKARDPATFTAGATPTTLKQRI